MPLFELIRNLSLALGALIGLYGLYFVVIGLNFFREARVYKKAKQSQKFAILVAARNEEKVIGRLIGSLQGQNYPKESYDIIVLANNCTDDTKGAALEAGAQVLEYYNNIRNKGDVLNKAFDDLKDADYDAFVIFDADNTVHPDFLQEMNKVYDEGFRACQGFREGQNPSDSYIAASYSIYMLTVDLFYNHPRSVLGMNSIITGTGFMVSKDLINELGGWNTSTLTEDLEFTVQNSLAGEQIAYAPRAIFYDEQVLTLSQSFVQRSRWSKGVRQIFEKMGVPAVKSIAKNEGKNVFDSLVMMSGTYMSNISLVATVLTMVFFNFVTPIFDGNLRFILVNLLSIVVIPTLLALFITLYSKKSLKVYGKGVLMYWFFLLTWIPINVYALFSRSVEWKEIKHGYESE